MTQIISYKRTEIPPPGGGVANIAFSVQKCATYSFFNRAESQIYTPKPCFVCNNVQLGTRSGKKYAFTVQKCAVNLSDMKKIITNQNTHYQILTTNY